MSGIKKPASVLVDEIERHKKCARLQCNLCLQVVSEKDACMTSNIVHCTRCDDNNIKQNKIKEAVVASSANTADISASPCLASTRVDKSVVSNNLDNGTTSSVAPSHTNEQEDKEECSTTGRTSLLFTLQKTEVLQLMNKSDSQIVSTEYLQERS